MNRREILKSLAAAATASSFAAAPAVAFGEPEDVENAPAGLSSNGGVIESVDAITVPAAFGTRTVIIVRLCQPVPNDHARAMVDQLREFRDEVGLDVEFLFLPWGVSLSVLDLPKMSPERSAAAGQMAM